MTALLVFALGFTACGGSEEKAEADSGNTTVNVRITAPADGRTRVADRVTVRGTVSPPDAAVQIVGRPAQVGNGVFAASVPLHRGSNTIDVVASADGAAPASETITVIRNVRRGPARIRTGGVPLARETNCGGGLAAGARTSCPFAENVRESYEQSGAGVLEVYSPTTGQTYRMYCTSGSPHVCKGGNGASLYFPDRGVVRTYSTRSCESDLMVGPNTSCAFAANVRAEYNRSGPGLINVYSPVTRRTYDMFCTSSAPHVCTGGNNAAVYFY